jgi:hypothetical protein
VHRLCGAAARAATVVGGGGAAAAAAAAAAAVSQQQQKLSNPRIRLAAGCWRILAWPADHCVILLVRPCMVLCAMMRRRGRCGGRGVRCAFDQAAQRGRPPSSLLRAERRCVLNREKATGVTQQHTPVFEARKAPCTAPCGAA